ncbi:MAG: PhoU domain-containing protein [Desulfurococcaceae archaeon]
MKYIRRLQFTGRSTFIVSLPKRWVLRNKLEPGEQVVLEERDSALLIKPMKTSSESKENPAFIEINQYTSPDGVTRLIIASYLMGYDEIIVFSKDMISPIIRNSIRRVILEKLPGTEIIYEDHSKIEIKVLLGFRGISIIETFKRLSKVVESILEDTCNAILKRDIDVANEVVKEDDSVDRVYFYLVRLLGQIAAGTIESDSVGTIDLLIYRSASKLLERVGDHAVNISQNMKDLINRGEVLEEAGKLCMETLDIYRESASSFVNDDPHSIEKISRRIHGFKIREEEVFSKFIQKLDPRETASLRIILESIRRIAEYSGDLAELALNRGLGKILSSLKQ